MKGYKVFNSDFKCRDMQFSENTEFSINVKPILCEQGFHFCEFAGDCFNYYDFKPENIISQNVLP